MFNIGFVGVDGELYKITPSYKEDFLDVRTYAGGLWWLVRSIDVSGYNPETSKSVEEYTVDQFNEFLQSKLR